LSDKKISLNLLSRCLLKHSSPQVWFCFLHFVLHEELWWRLKHSDNPGIFIYFSTSFSFTKILQLYDYHFTFSAHHTKIQALHVVWVVCSERQQGYPTFSVCADNWRLTARYMSFISLLFLSRKLKKQLWMSHMLSFCTSWTNLCNSATTLYTIVVK
jgi:hypothetical protein